jgi:hypothetical protein
MVERRDRLCLAMEPRDALGILSVRIRQDFALLSTRPTRRRYDGRVNPTLADGLRALEEATELAKSIRIELDEEYRRLIALAEALPSNQSGADKTWVGRMDTAFRTHYRETKRQ